MQSIQLSDQLYQEALRRACDAGFESVDQYIAEIVKHHVNSSGDDYDKIFTPQVIAQLNHIHAEVQAGAKTFSQEEVEQHFMQKAQAWPEHRGN